MTKAQQTYERINALVDGGMQKAEAFKQLAEEYGQPVDSVRGAYYGHKRVVDTGGQPGAGRSAVRRPRKRDTTTQDAIASAVASLRGAIDSIELELETARERADEATAEYEAMRSASSGRIEEIRARWRCSIPRPARSRRPRPSRTLSRRRRRRASRTQVRPGSQGRSRARSGPTRTGGTGTRG